MSTTQPPAETALPDQPAANGGPPRPSLIEAVFDNLPAWTVVAAAIGLLYLVWATLAILSLYTGDIPKVRP